ncbi:MAG: DUF4199 domain-containing protein [Gemmatimonadaceae bacterium]|nr:DUF4199 domain-containing protein [Gemmatimonadaceae bacterium]
MRRIVLTFGLIAGAIMSAMLVITLVLFRDVELDRGAVVGYASMVLAFLMVFVGVRNYRDTIAGGRIGFGRAFGVGLLITVVAIACYVVTWEIIYFNFAPEFGEKYASYAVEQARRAGADSAAIARTQQEMDAFLVRYRNPLFNAAITFLEPLPIGLLFALVTGWLTSRRRGSAAAAASPTP